MLQTFNLVTSPDNSTIFAIYILLKSLKAEELSNL